MTAEEINTNYSLFHKLFLMAPMQKLYTAIFTGYQYNKEADILSIFSLKAGSADIFFDMVSQA
jgi:hypothetical protein